MYLINHVFTHVFLRRKVILSVCVAIIAFTSCGYFFLQKTKGFLLYKIRSTLVFNSRWEIPEPTNSEKLMLHTFFNQRFYFLDKGAQCYAFLSEDKKHVIKFFKLHSLRPPFWLKNLSFPPHMQVMRLSKMLEKKTALIKTFDSYKIAYDELRDQTGLEYIHLNKTDYLKQKITVVDSLGFSHHLDLDQMEFLVQKTAHLFYPYFERTLKENGTEAGKQTIAELIAFLVARNKKAIFDKDPDLSTNFGFIDNKIVQIDIGRFRKDPSRTNTEIYRDEIMRITSDFHSYLEKNYPVLSEYLEKSLKNL